MVQAYELRSSTYVNLGNGLSKRVCRAATTK